MRPAQFHNGYRLAMSNHNYVGYRYGAWANQREDKYLIWLGDDYVFRSEEGAEAKARARFIPRHERMHAP